MTDVHRVLTPSDYPGPSVPRTVWGSWVYFTAVMLVMIGSFEAIAGLVALFKDDFYLVRPSGLAISVSYTHGAGRTSSSARSRSARASG